MKTSIPGDIEFLIPYYGDPHQLEQTVNSVLSQSDPRWSLVVVQDGPSVVSRDGWVKSLDDKRITYLANAENLGVAGNFEQCLKLSTRSHVVFLGCDDVLLPGYVGVLQRVLQEHPEADVIQPGVIVIDSEGRAVRPVGDRIKARIALGPGRFSGEPLLSSLMHGNWTYFPSLCWRRDHIALHGFRADLAVTLDLALLARVILEGGTMVVIPERVFQYRRHALSASSLAAASAERFDEERRLFTDIAQVCRSRRWNHAARAARWHLSSRLHAGLLLPRRATPGTRSQILRHVMLP